MPASPRRAIASLLRLCAVAVLAALLGACATPEKHDGDTTAQAKSRTQAADEAARLLAAGDHRGAARKLLDQAAQAQPPRREALQLAAAEALLQGGFAEDAAALLQKLPAGGSNEFQTRRALAEANVLLARKQPLAALQRLAGLSDDIAPERMVDFHRLRIAAYDAAGNHLESARERVWLDGLLPDSDRPANQQAIWESLARLPDAVLAGMRTAPPPDVFSGWMELVETTRAVRDNPQQLDIALAIWRERYPQHPASSDFIRGMQSRLAEYTPTAMVGQTAVLLPLSGPLAEAGQAVRDGMLAAYFHSGARTPLRFYDTGARNAAQTWALYQQAVTDGAQMVIGPLTKEAAAALAGSGKLTVPVLALNTLGGTAAAPEQFYQFGLTPEDEAAQVAERAWQDGRRSALALTPDSAWGQRVYQAFAARWQSLGGTLLRHAAYGDDERGYSATVRGLLDAAPGVRQPETPPAQTPQAAPAQAQTQPAADTHFLFLAANAPQARMIRPLLRYHFAGTLAVYATSQVHEGPANASLDRDMDGIRFCDMPWMLPSGHPLAALRSEIARLWPARDQRYARLFALGIDALQIAPYLQGLRDGSYSRHPGVSGDLYLDKERRVHRDLQWAEFSNGKPVALPDVTAPPPPSPPPAQDHTDAYPATAAAPGTGLTR